MSNNLRAMIDAIMNNQNDMINQNDDDNRYIKELKIGKTRSRIATTKINLQFVLFKQYIGLEGAYTDSDGRVIGCWLVEGGTESQDIMQIEKRLLKSKILNLNRIYG